MLTIYTLYDRVKSNDGKCSSKKIKTFLELSSAKAAGTELIESGVYTADQLFIIETRTHTF